MEARATSNSPGWKIAAQCCAAGTDYFANEPIPARLCSGAPQALGGARRARMAFPNERTLKQCDVRRTV
jgi:hypothetical protein